MSVSPRDEGAPALPADTDRQPGHGTTRRHSRQGAQPAHRLSCPYQPWGDTGSPGNAARLAHRHGRQGTPTCTTFSLSLFYHSLPLLFHRFIRPMSSYNKILNRKVFTSNRRIIFSWKSSANVTSRSRDNIEILDKGIALRKIIWNTCRKDEAQI